jgi:hypothetical protein
LWGYRISDIHNFAAILGFGGILLAILGFNLIKIKDIFKFLGGKRVLDADRYFLAIIPILIGIVGMAVSQALRGLWGYNDFPGPGLLSFTFWEWIALLMIWLYHIIIIAVLPESLD